MNEQISNQLVNTKCNKLKNQFINLKVGHTVAMELFVVTMHRKRVNDFEFDLYLQSVDVEMKIVSLITATEDRV